MAEYTSKLQKNQGWNLTWSALDRYPMIAKRRFNTLADAQAFVDDVAEGASATEGLIISVIRDSVAKNNGVYYVSKVANTDAEYGEIRSTGELIKVGGSETETATNYSAAKELSKTLVVGQLIKVANPEEIEETVDGETVKNTYQAGFYIVEGAGVISALATSTGSDDEVGALKTRVDALETGRVKTIDFESYKGTVAASLETKANASDLTTHTANTDIHVSVVDRAAWNNAEGNAKTYADTYFVKKDGDKVLSTEDFTSAEKTKLAGIAEGAQVNVLEGVKVNDVELTITDKKVNIDLSVYAIADETATKSALQALEQIVNGKANSEDVYTKTEADSTFLKSADYKEYDDAEVRNLIGGVSGRVETLEAIKHISDVTYNTTDKKIYLVSDDEKIGNGFDASAFIKDGMVSSVAYDKDNQTITISFNTDAGKDDITVTLSDLVNIYEAGNGLILSDDGKTFSVDFDKVEEKGAADSVQSNLNALAELVGTRAEGETAASGIFTDLAALVAKDNAQDEVMATKADKSDVETLSDVVDTKADKTVVESLAELVGTRAEGETDASGIFADLASLVAKDSEHTSAISALKSLKVNDKAIVNDSNEVNNIVLDAGDIKLESAITPSVENGASFTSDKTIQEVLESISRRIDSLDPTVNGEYGVAEVDGGYGISISGSKTNPVINLVVDSAEGNMLSISANGIYVKPITISGNDMDD